MTVILANYNIKLINDIVRAQQLSSL